MRIPDKPKICNGIKNKASHLTKKSFAGELFDEIFIIW